MGDHRPPIDSPLRLTPFKKFLELVTPAGIQSRPMGISESMSLRRFDHPVTQNRRKATESEVLIKCNRRSMAPPILREGETWNLENLGSRSFVRGETFRVRAVSDGERNHSLGFSNMRVPRRRASEWHQHFLRGSSQY